MIRISLVIFFCLAMRATAQLYHSHLDSHGHIRVQQNLQRRSALFNQHLISRGIGRFIPGLKGKGKKAGEQGPSEHGSANPSSSNQMGLGNQKASGRPSGSSVQRKTIGKKPAGSEGHSLRKPSQTTSTGNPGLWRDDGSAHQGRPGKISDLSSKGVSKKTQQAVSDASLSRNKGQTASHPPKDDGPLRWAKAVDTPEGRAAWKKTAAEHGRVESDGTTSIPFDKLGPGFFDR